MVWRSLFVSALLVSSAIPGTEAFAPPPVPQTTHQGTVLSAGTVRGSEVDPLGNNVKVRDLLQKVEGSGLLTKVAKSGLLSKAQKAGISLSKLEPLLVLASENKDVLILAEAAGPEILPILPTLVDLAPPILPLLGLAISIPPVLIGGVGLGSFAAAAGVVIAIPDDTVLQVAEQTLAVGVLFAVGAISLIGSFVLGSLTK